MADFKLEELAEMVNIAEELDDNKLTYLGRKVKDGFETDLDSRSEWEDNNDRWMKLASQVIEQKSFPWPNSSNVKYPLLTTAAIQFHARAYPALVPSNNIVKGMIVGEDVTGEKAASAARVSKHMSYQLLQEMDEWEDEMDRLLITLPIIGCVFKKTYYNPDLDRNVSEMVLPKHLVVNYWAKTLKDSYRITQIMEISKNKFIERVRAGIYLDADIGNPKQSSYNTRAVEDENQGTSPSDDESVPYTILEQHTYCDLDDDGYEEPYIITIDENTGRVLRIVANYSIDDIEYNEDNEVIRITPFSHYTKYPFIPNPDGGFYDVGFGILLGPLNESANTVINQLIDAGTLSNMQSGFLGRGIKLKKGNSDFKPGEWKYINVTGDDLRKSILPLPVREPSQVLFQLLGQLLDSGNRLASTTDMMVGENPGQNQKASTTMAVLEQGMKVFTAIYKRLYRSLGKEFKKLYELNSEYLDYTEYFNILDSNVEDQQKVFLSDYDTTKVNILPAADPNVVTSAQRLAKAQALLELIPLGVNPQVVLKRVLEAQEHSNIEELLQPVEQGPDPEMALKEKELELKASVENRKLDIKEYELGIKGEMDAEKIRQTARKQDTEDAKVLNEMLKSDTRYIRGSDR